MPRPESPRQRKRATSHLRHLEKLRQTKERPLRLPDPADRSALDAQIDARRRQKRREKLDQYGEENRAELTQAEAAMQRILIEMGWRFSTEHPKYQYILDFYVPKYRLAIEVDGGYHRAERQRRKDRQRDRFLVSRGFLVCRLTNEQVLNFPRKCKATLRKLVSAPEIPSERLHDVLPYDEDRTAINALQRISRQAWSL